MALSVFDIFKIGIGPSSSHTVGPMNAARQFALDLEAQRLLAATRKVSVQLYGSLALTGKGHCTDRAVLLGLEGHRPDEIETDTIESTLARIRSTGRLQMLGKHEIEFDEPLDVLFHRTQVLPGHSNGMRFAALDANGQVLLSEEFYSIGGGFIQRAGESADDAAKATVTLPYPFSSAEELLSLGRTHGLEIYELMLANERTWRTDEETRAGLMRIWGVMQECVERGFNAQGVLPGVLKVRRRAPKLYRTLASEGGRRALEVMDWVNTFRARRERGKRGRRSRGDRADQRRGRDHPRRPALLPALRARRGRRRRGALPADGGSDRHALQAECVDLGRGDGLPGRGRGGVLDGRRRAGGGAAWNERADRERRGDRHGAQPGSHLRSDRRAWCRSRASSATRWAR